MRRSRSSIISLILSFKFLSVSVSWISPLSVITIISYFTLSILLGPQRPQCPIAIGTNGNHLFIHLFTSFSGHKPAQRECAWTGLRSHARCHPYPIPQPIKVDHTTEVYDPYSLRIVMWVLLHPTSTNQWKCCETGPTVFHPYLRRLESLTICRCHYKGSTFFSVI